MKKKVLSLVLLVAFLATGCASNKQVVTPGYDWAESGADVSTQKSEESSTEETSKETTEESVTEQSKEESKEETKEEKPVLTLPTELSDNLLDFQIEIDGEILQFPMWYSDFVKLGWTYDGNPEDRLDAGSYYSYAEFQKNGMTFEFALYNYGINALPVSECLISGVSMDVWSMEDVAATINLPCGISYGTSTVADLEAAYGTPDDSYAGTYYTEYTYTGVEGYYTMVRFEVSAETNVLSSIEIRNLVELEGICEEGTIFYDEVPAMVSEYAAPAGMSDNLQDYTVQVGEVVLSLPAPLSVLLNDGWSVEDDVEIIPGRWNEYLYLEKGSQQISVSVINTHDNAVAVGNTMIYDIEVSSYDHLESTSFAAGITLGMTEDELLAVLEGYAYESSDYDTSRVYDLELEGDYNTSYSIWIREGVVDQMSVSYRPDSLYE